MYTAGCRYLQGVQQGQHQCYLGEPVATIFTWLQVHSSGTFNLLLALEWTNTRSIANSLQNLSAFMLVPTPQDKVVHVRCDQVLKYVLALTCEEPHTALLALSRLHVPQ